MFTPAQIRILPLMLTAVITVGRPVVAAETGEWDEPSRPHNYSLPRDAALPRQGLTGEAASAPTRHDAANLPDLGAATGNAGQRGHIHMPYGSGYEARQLGGTSGGGVGSGRGMGRRR